MDVYHKVLVKLFEATGGRDTQTVDLKELVKSEGFLGNYNEIFQLLSGKGWIAETTRADAVKITHWGVKEARKSKSGVPDNSLAVKREANKMVSSAKELLILLEEFAYDRSMENLKQVEKKIGELNSSIGKLKEDI
jgi:hypothetical protein